LALRQWCLAVLVATLVLNGCAAVVSHAASRTLSVSVELADRRLAGPEDIDTAVVSEGAGETRHFQGAQVEIPLDPAQGYRLLVTAPGHRPAFHQVRWQPLAMDKVLILDGGMAVFGSLLGMTIGACVDLAVSNRQQTGLTTGLLIGAGFPLATAAVELLLTLAGQLSAYDTTGVRVWLPPEADWRAAVPSDPGVL
jgi:hypothetical protein